MFSLAIASQRYLGLGRSKTVVAPEGLTHNDESGEMSYFAAFVVMGRKCKSSAFIGPKIRKAVTVVTLRDNIFCRRLSGFHPVIDLFQLL